MTVILEASSQTLRTKFIEKEIQTVMKKTHEVEVQCEKIEIDFDKLAQLTVENLNKIKLQIDKLLD